MRYTSKRCKGARCRLRTGRCPRRAGGRAGRALDRIRRTYSDAPLALKILIVAVCCIVGSPDRNPAGARTPSSPAAGRSGRLARSPSSASRWSRPWRAAAGRPALHLVLLLPVVAAFVAHAGRARPLVRAVPHGRLGRCWLALLPGIALFRLFARRHLLRRPGPGLAARLGRAGLAARQGLAGQQAGGQPAATARRAARSRRPAAGRRASPPAGQARAGLGRPGQPGPVGPQAAGVRPAQAPGQRPSRSRPGRSPHRRRTEPVGQAPAGPGGVPARSPIAPTARSRTRPPSRSRRRWPNSTR